MNLLKITAATAELAILAATASVAWALVSDSGNVRIVAPMIVAATAIEAVRLPLALRAPKLGFIGAASAMTLAAALSVLTAETMALGVDSVLSARSLAVTAAETRLAEAQTGFDAAKADMVRQDGERDRLVAEVAAAQRHAEEIGRETVALQANPAVTAYRVRKGWAAPGAGAANAVAAANARSQAEHDHRAAGAETNLAAARAAVAALRQVDLKAEEGALVAAQQDVERERAANPLSRVAASFYRVDTANLRAEDYQGFRRLVTLSLAMLMASGTLAAGLISALPERGARPSKLARALRAWLARRRKPIVVRCNVPGPERVTERIVVKWVPFDWATGRRIKPDGEPGEVVSPASWTQKS